MSYHFGTYYALRFTPPSSSFILLNIYVYKYIYYYKCVSYSIIRFFHIQELIQTFIPHINDVILQSIYFEKKIQIFVKLRRDTFGISTYAIK